MAGNANAINEGTTGITGFTGTAFTGTAVTNHAVLIGGSTSSTITSLGPTSTSGQVLQSAGASADPAFSTATYPATATGTGTILRADGTNWAATTSTYPNTNAVSTLLYASSANVMAALATANSGVLTTSSSGVPSIDTTNFSVLSTGVQVKGNNTNTAPPSGFIGQEIISSVGSGAPVTVTPTATAVNLTSITLTPGVWDVSLYVTFTLTANCTGQQIGISANSASFTGTVTGLSSVLETAATSIQTNNGLNVIAFRILVSSNTTYYAVVLAAFPVTAPTAYGTIKAVRVG